MTLMDPLNIYVIYKHPRDVPHAKYLVRRWELLIPKDVLYAGDSLEEARALIPRGLTKVMPEPKDDPVILETWI